MLARVKCFQIGDLTFSEVFYFYFKNQNSYDFLKFKEKKKNK